MSSKESTKHCPKCDSEKPIDSFGRDAAKVDGRYIHCKSCRRTPSRKELVVEQLAEKGLKKCTSCEKVKPFCAYDNDSQKRFGVTSRCKKCRSEQRRMLSREGTFSKIEIEHLHGVGKSRCYRCLRAKPLSSFMKDKKSRPGVYNLCLDCKTTVKRDYKGKRRTTVKDYTRWEVFEADNFVCYICEDLLSPDVFSPDPHSLTIDHVVPLARGGLDERDNVRTACLGCNQKKDDSTLEEFLDEYSLI